MKQGWQEALRIHCQVLRVLGCDLRNEQLLAALKCQGAARAPGSTGLWCGLLPAQQGPLPGPQDTSGESQPGRHCGCVTQGWGHGCEWTLLPCPVRGWSWQGQPAAQPCRGEGLAQAQGGQEGQGQAAQGPGDLGALCRFWSELLLVSQRGCKQPISQLCSAFIARIHSSEQYQYFFSIFFKCLFR